MRALILPVLLLLLSQAAHAALFDDDGARQKIIELQQQMQLQSVQTQKNQQALEQRVAAMEAIIKGQGLLDLLSQIDRLNQELNQTKGDLDVANHTIDQLQQRQRDLYADTDGRLRKLEGGATALAPNGNIPQAAAPADTAVSDQESKDFDAAQTLSRNGKYKEAFDAYQKFLQTYPASARIADAQYALGYAQFALKNYKASIATQQKLLKQFPDSAKAPDALFSIANSQIQLADIDGAKKTLHSLLDKYPTSDVIPNAKRRLTVLDSIKSN